MTPSMLIFQWSVILTTSNILIIIIMHLTVIISSLLIMHNVMAQDYEYEYEEDPNAIEGLPASAADLLDAPYDDGFNCDQQDAGYGYYADTLNNCQVFHICNPVYNNDGELDRMDKYSFVCGENTVFDQQTLTCNHPEDAFPCQESPSLYGAVEFGKIESDY